MIFKTRLPSCLTRATRGMAILGGLGILFIAVMVTADVLLRKLFNATLGGAAEIAGLIFAISTAISYPFMLLDRANIRIDVVYARLKTPTRAVLDLISALLVLYFVAALVNSAWKLFSKSWQLDSMTIGVVQMPLWMPQLLWLMGLGVFALAALFLTIHALAGIVRRDWSGVIRAAGIPNIEEEIHGALHDVGHDTGTR